MTRTSDKRYYIIESSGPDRCVWGPYTLDQARHEAGVRHVVVTGLLKNRQKLLQAEMQASVHLGHITPVDPGVVLS